MSCSKCNDVFAEPMLDGDEYLQKYKKQLVELGKKGLLPPLDVSLRYNIYSIRANQFGGHKSIVLSTDGRHFVTVELGFTNEGVDGKKHIYPVARQLDESYKSKLMYHGAVNAKGKNLIAKAVAAMKKFGTYFKPCNNCQDFCNVFLKEIGLEQEARRLTDGDKISLAAGTLGTTLGGIAVGLLAIL